MRSKTVQRILDKMEKDSWYTRLGRYIRLKLWTWKCLTRKYWDSSFSGYIFKKK